ncbi:MAG: helix-turn-helix domain-containing protein [Oscillospiraceae bacterium]|nr:helix-turn-helix domain-containing protein [Oscillospiraceae bacterium]MCL2279412.1 helix-turn-helix domain-containing protein [Oscillospiraceae bacterium]
MSLGEKIRSLRLRAKRSLKDQSKLLRVSMNSLYRWEHDLVIPRRPMLERIADGYDVTLDWLLSDSSMPSLVNETENKLLGLYRTLPSPVKYKVLGYVERVCVEEKGTGYRR